MATPAGEESQFTGEGCRSAAKVRLAAVAARQRGRIRYDQIQALGVSDRTIRRWRDDGYLHRVLPRVYAVGHPGTSIEADLAAAVLYAGPGAMLSHATAIWWLGLLKYPAAQIIVSTPRRVRNRANIVVRGGRRLERTWHQGLPVTSSRQAILDFAATGRFDRLRLVLANAEYQDLLDVDGLRRMMGRGVPGSAALREAIRVHLPELAHTRSELEILLLGLCERYVLPLPRCNVILNGWLVDAHWADQRLVAEVDGCGGHRTSAQVRRDHQRDLELRRAGYIVLRYTWSQLADTPGAVASELLVHLAGKLGPQAQDGLRVQL